MYLFLFFQSAQEHIQCLLQPRSSRNSMPSSQSQTNTPETYRYIISPNTKITSDIRCGDLNSALQVFRIMNIRNRVSWNSILAGFSSKPRKFKEARQLFDVFPEPDNVSYNLMLACYFRNGHVGAAKDFFNKIPVKATASWNNMLSGLSRNGMMDEAWELFVVMPRTNAVTWKVMISGYVSSGNMELALQLFSEASSKGVVAWTSIITGYMKSGKVELAEKTSDEMPEKNLVTWHAMISGYVENGRGEDALKLFKKMMESEIQGSVLLASSNLSILKLGKQIHQRIFTSPMYFDIRVGTSLISMYCKSGVLEDGWKLFL